MKTTEPTSGLLLSRAPRQFKPYPSYRHSGVQWLGGIPTQWDTKRLKNCVQDLRSGGTPESDNFDYWQGHVHMLSSSNTQDNLSAEKVRAMPVFLPSLAEQHRIAAFLDRGTARIDGLVAKKERLIELLQTTINRSLLKETF